MNAAGGHLRQVLGSLLVAVAIVALVVVVVTSKLGPTSTAELEAREEAREQRIEAIEERQDARDERLQERAEGSR